MLPLLAHLDRPRSARGLEQALLDLAGRMPETSLAIASEDLQHALRAATSSYVIVSLAQGGRMLLARMRAEDAGAPANELQLSVRAALARWDGFSIANDFLDPFARLLADGDPRAPEVPVAGRAEVLAYPTVTEALREKLLEPACRRDGARSVGRRHAQPDRRSGRRRTCAVSAPFQSVPDGAGPGRVRRRSRSDPAMTRGSLQPDVEGRSRLPRRRRQAPPRRAPGRASGPGRSRTAPADGALDVDDRQSSRFGHAQLPVVSGHKLPAEGEVRRRHVEEIKTAGEELCRVAA